MRLRAHGVPRQPLLEAGMDVRDFWHASHPLGWPWGHHWSSGGGWGLRGLERLAHATRSLPAIPGPLTKAHPRYPPALLGLWVQAREGGSSPGPEQHTQGAGAQGPGSVGTQKDPLPLVCQENQQHPPALSGMVHH